MSTAKKFEDGKKHVFPTVKREPCADCGRVLYHDKSDRLVCTYCGWFVLKPTLHDFMDRVVPERCEHGISRETACMVCDGADGLR